MYDVQISPEALTECLGPVDKPDSRLVSDVLTAWQKDRNYLRFCVQKNKEKIVIIQELIHEPIK